MLNSGLHHWIILIQQVSMPSPYFNENFSEILMTDLWAEVAEI